jgi:hypothetical protein
MLTFYTCITGTNKTFPSEQALIRSEATKEVKVSALVAKASLQPMFFAHLYTEYFCILKFRADRK